MTMMNLSSLFVEVPTDCDVVFVSDAFVSDYVGGAELTTEALLEKSPFRVFRIKSSNVTLKVLEEGYQKYWIFGNFANLDKNLIPTICANLSYSVIEYDYKFCKYRSPEKHQEIEKKVCDCENDASGKMVSAFLYGAKSLWWMSEQQETIYSKRFPFLREKSNTILSSVFNEETLAYIKLLRSQNENVSRQGWIVLGSPSWIKGTSDAEDWCKENNLQYELVWNIPYNQLLEKLAKAEGLVFLPRGADTCPRLVIEAKLLGCKLHLNDNVQHRKEIWFDTDDLFDTEAYLYLSADRFWNGVRNDMLYRPKISGYTTTRNCLEQDYPFRESIRSMLGFCDEVVVVDGGSTDGTWEMLSEWSRSEPKLVVHRQERDWTKPRFALFDGMQKALARSLCTGDYLWQQDSDEIVHENDYERIREFVRHIPKNLQLVCLPIVEYWGPTEKVRVDVNLWKWRLSANNPAITHGIPKELRQFDAQGELYSRPGCDGCFYVRNSDYETIPSANFMTDDVLRAQQTAFVDANARVALQEWLQNVMKTLPTVHHYSWFNIGRKIRTYRDYWSKHWESLYDVKQEDVAENNKFFDKAWAYVSEDEIDELAKKLSNEMGGWVFHQRVDFSRPTPWLKLDVKHPEVMNEWLRRNS
jgi:glycosyltransferase involved in cell wall biosynthesis